MQHLLIGNNSKTAWLRKAELHSSLAWVKSKALCERVRGEALTGSVSNKRAYLLLPLGSCHSGVTGCGLAWACALWCDKKMSSNLKWAKGCVQSSFMNQFMWKSGYTSGLALGLGVTTISIHSWFWGFPLWGSAHVYVWVSRIGFFVLLALGSQNQGCMKLCIAAKVSLAQSILDSSNMWSWTNVGHWVTIGHCALRSLLLLPFFFFLK